MRKTQKAMLNRSKKQADVSGTEPALKPKREDPRQRLINNNASTTAACVIEDKVIAPRDVRSKSKERITAKRMRKLGVKTEERDCPLLPDEDDDDEEGGRAGVIKSPRRMLARLSLGYTRTRPLSSPGNSQPKRTYEPPPSPSADEDTISDKYSSERAVDDATRDSPALHPRAQMNKEKYEKALSPDLSEITSNTGTFTEGSAFETTFTGTETTASSARGWTKDEQDVTNTMTETTQEAEEDFELLTTFKSQSTEGAWSDFDPTGIYKQTIAGASIVISAIQLALLFIQLILCGVASLDVNPMIGPYPDAFSEWGGKNAYLMLDQHQYFRLFTPVLLHVGVLHFLANAFCQLEPCALLEREWGTCRWLTAYILSGIGAVATSCVFNPDEIGVSSSGAIMGLFGAKISQILAYNCFKVHSRHYLDVARFDQMGGIFCSSSIIFLLSLVTYIDLSANVGGFVSGFLAGMLLFCRGIASGCSRFVWAFIGFGGLVAGASTLSYFLWVETYPDSELADACEYFRNLYPEGYDCECKWG